MDNTKENQIRPEEQKITAEAPDCNVFGTASEERLIACAVAFVEWAAACSATTLPASLNASLTEERSLRKESPTASASD